MSLQEFLAAEAGKPFRWGETDCASMIDRWVGISAGVSPLAVFGRRHHDEQEARAWLSERGSLALAFRQVMKAAGFEETRCPQVGDVGLAVRDRKLCSAINVGSHWLSRDAGGFIAAPLPHFYRAWSICRQP